MNNFRAAGVRSTPPRRLVPWLCGLALLAGCKSATVVEEFRTAPTPAIGQDESIVILGRRHSTGYETESDFIRCVGKSLGQGGLRVIPEQVFVDGMYPHFETSTAPMDIKKLHKLVENPRVINKFNEFGIRYFVWIDGATERTDSSGSVACAVGPGGGGCFGFAYWQDEAGYEASIWDFKELALSGRISAETRGTSFMPAVVIPVPLPARVQANACKAMSNQIRAFFSGQPG